MRSFSTDLKEVVNASIEEAYFTFLNGDPTKFYTGYGPIPACKRIESQTENWPSVGATRKVVTADNYNSVERIVELKEFTYIKMISNEFTNLEFNFIDRMESEIKFKEINEGKTKVLWTYTFISIRNHLKTRVLANMIFPQAMKKVMKQAKYFAETRTYL